MKYILIFSCSLFSSIAIGGPAICTNLAIGLNIPEHIDVTKRRNGDVIGTSIITLNGGTCNKTVPAGNPFPGAGLTLFSNVRDDRYCRGTGTLNGYGYVNDIKGYLRYPCTSGTVWYASPFDNGYSQSSVYVPIMVPMNSTYTRIILNKKPPVGKTHIAITELFNPLIIKSSENVYTEVVPSQGNIESVNLSGNYNKGITLINRASCNLTIDNSINFGNVTLRQVTSGGVPKKTINIGINCDGVPLKYTMTLSSALNEPTTNLSKGILGSTNNTVGYQLTWGDSQVGNANTNIVLESPHISKSAKLSQTVPIKIKPVALDGVAIEGGKTDALLRITVRID